MLFEANCKPFANDLKAIYAKKVYYFESNKPLSKLWYHQESNRGHKDFQSFALPTELWHHFSIASAKVVINYVTGKFCGTFLYYFLFICTLFRFLQYLCTAFKRRKPVAKAILRFAIGIRFWHRDVAQLVAHYVRDVGVGRSSRLIPTISLRTPCSWCPFLSQSSSFCFVRGTK